MARFEFTSRRSGGAPKGGVWRASGSVIFLGFIVLGSLFALLLLWDAGKKIRTFSWKKTECTIVSSGVEETDDDDSPYRFNVEYLYEVGGRTYRSERFHATAGKTDDDYATIYRLTRTFAPETRTFCYTNPRNPKEAVLRRPLPWSILFLPFPLVFAGIGLGGIYFTWRPRKAKPERKEAISSRARGNVAAWIARFLFGGLFLSGGGLLLFYFGPAALKHLAARSWKETPCTVLSSKLRSHTGGDETTYSVDIVVSYEIDGTEYRSNRYTFLGGSSSGYGWQARVVAQHPVGRETACYVNPNDPWDAVLNHAFTRDFLFGLIPLTFFVVGFFGLAYHLTRRGRREKAADHPDWMPAVPVSSNRTFAGSALSDAIAQSGPVTLKPRSGPVVKLLGAFAFSVFWNGVVMFFLYQAWLSFHRGYPDWFLTIFMIPFVLVGLISIGVVVYFLLALFNPWPTLTVSAPAASLGGSVDVGWELSGRSSSIERLRITLEGREESTYRRGTRTYTDAETFAEIDLADTTDGYEMARGEHTLAIPSDTIHSFEAPNNKIIWALKVHAAIRRWPDMKEEFPFVVLPAPHSHTSRAATG